MQQPRPTNTTGVQVNLFGCSADGTVMSIGQAESDGEGYFQYEWTPPDEGYYKIMASFDGDESYYSSWNITGLAVGPEPTPYPEAPTEQDVAEEVVGQLPDYTTMDLVLIAAVAIAIIIGIVNLWALRKR